MKLNSAYRYFPLLILVFCATVLQAQLFSPPQAFMNHKGFDSHSPPENCRTMQVQRYIPGARFPGGIDVLIEDFTFDEAGHLLTWRKYKSVMGDLMLETNYKWNDAGLVQQEQIQAAGNPTALIRDYAWEAPSGDGSKKASIKNGQGKVIGSFEVLLDGSTRMIENIGSNGQNVITTYNKKGDVLSVNNESTGITEAFSYDENGFLIAVEAKSSAGTAKIAYESKKDKNGRILSQTETGKGASKTIYFQYDEAGRLTVKGNSPTHIGEMRNYDHAGRLHDVVYFDDNGFATEVLFFTYTSFFK